MISLAPIVLGEVYGEAALAQTGDSGPRRMRQPAREGGDLSQRRSGLGRDRPQDLAQLAGRTPGQGLRRWCIICSDRPAEGSWSWLLGDVQSCRRRPLLDIASGGETGSCEAKANVLADLIPPPGSGGIADGDLLDQFHRQEGGKQLALGRATGADFRRQRQDDMIGPLGSGTENEQLSDCDSLAVGHRVVFLLERCPMQRPH